MTGSASPGTEIPKERSGAATDADLADLAARVDALPVGHGDGLLDGRRYGVTVDVSGDRRRWWLYAEELGGRGRISFNLYRLDSDRWALRPCEMPAAKVIDFVRRYVPAGIVEEDRAAGARERIR